MGALTKILEYIADNGPVAADNLRRMLMKLAGESSNAAERNAARVGEQYVDAALRNPDFFTQGRAYADSEEGLAKQFGVGVAHPIDGDSFKRSVWGDVFRPAEPGTTLKDTSHGLTEYHIPLKHGAPPEDVSYSTNAARKVMSDAGVDWRGFQDARKYDATQFEKGSGAGQKVYAAAFGGLRLNPDAVNVTDVLTPSNRIRRSFNQSAAIARDPMMARQIITDESQLRQLQLSPADVHRMKPTDRIGALQLAGNAELLQQMRSKLEMYHDLIKRKGEFTDPQILADVARLTQAINELSVSGGWNTDVLRNAGANISKVRKIDIPPFGDRTARRLGFSLRALDGQDTSDLVRGLEYRCGGSVKKGTPRRRLERLGV